MTIPASQNFSTVDEIAAELDTAWRDAGVPRAERHRLRSDVLADLGEAINAGVDPRAILTPDITTFADQVADANSSPRLLPISAHHLLTSAVGGLLAVLLALPAAVITWNHLSDHNPHTASTSLATTTAIYLPLLVAGLLGATAGLGIALRHAGRTAATVARALPLLTATAAVVTPALVLLGRATDYATSVVAVDVITSAALYYFAIAMARRWALRGSLD